VSAVAAVLAVLMLVPGPAAKDWRPKELRVSDQRIDSFEDLREIALSYIGRPYSMGGVGSPAFDCSGYVCRVYAEAGYPLPRVSRDQARAGRAVPLRELQPGDLLFFADPEEPISHVGIYVGDGEMIHASSGRGKVTVSGIESLWFNERLVAARRVLTSSAAVEIVPEELVEHGERVLLPMLDRPPRLPLPSFGPELAGLSETSIGLRSALITERGILGLVLSPEAALSIDQIALSLAVAVPIRFALHQTPTVGAFEKPGDYVRFLRSLTLGLPGADLELSFSRLGDHALAQGFLVRRHAPGARAGGVTGLTVETAPLTFYGAGRTKYVRVEGLIDDVFDPSLIGASAMVPLFDLIELGAAYVTHQGERAVNAVEADVVVHAVESSEVSIDVAATGATVRSLGKIGGGVMLAVDGQYRFGGAYDSALSLIARGGWLGPRSLSGLFGPTFAIDPESHRAALDRTRSRPVLGGELNLRFHRFTVGGVFESGVGPERDALDQVVEGLLALEGISLGGTRFLDLRAAYAARSLFRDEPRLDVLFASLRLRFASWLFVEMYLQKGGTFEGGGGVTITWVP
jgi:hypothetical protein